MVKEVVEQYDLTLHGNAFTDPRRIWFQAQHPQSCHAESYNMDRIRKLTSGASSDPLKHVRRGGRFINEKRAQKAEV